MPEVTDTNPDIYPEGRTTLKAVKPAVKKLTNAGKPFYIFEFEGMVDGDIKTHKEVRMPWMCADILRAFGFPETKPGVFTWEKNDVDGKAIDCVIVHEPDFKDKTKIRARITEPTEGIPF